MNDFQKELRTTVEKFRLDKIEPTAEHDDRDYGEFNSTDLVAVFSAGQYEDTIEDNSTWATGDWNADGDFDSGDLVLAFTDGGYEQGPRPAAVPEPTGLMLIVGAAILIASRRGNS